MDEVAHTLFLEETAADNLRHGDDLLLLELLGGKAGVEVVQELTGEGRRGRRGRRGEERRRRVSREPGTMETLKGEG